METFRARHISEIDPEIFNYELVGDRFEQFSPMELPQDKKLYSLFDPKVWNDRNYDLQRSMHTYRNSFCPEIMSQYQYEEVNLSSIQMGDVIIFNDCLIPFWTPYKITKRTIILSPCAVNRKIGKRLSIRNHGRQGTMSFEGYGPEYGFTNRPLSGFCNFIVDSSQDVECLCGNTICECNEKIEAVEATITSARMRIIFNKKTMRKNGIHQEIKVRKFTGTEDQMVLHNFQTDENYHEHIRDPIDRIHYMIRPIEKKHIPALRRMQRMGEI